MRLMLAAASLTLLLLCACDQQRINKLQVGVSTEAEVRQQFGEPPQIVEKADGSKVLHYPRQPEGTTNYEIVMDPEGRLRSVRQLLTPENFALVQPGMTQTEVSTLLGKHANQRKYAMKPDETTWEWRYLVGQDKKIFSVVFGPDQRVRETRSDEDLRASQGGN